jgi:hypothetical protein
VGEQHDAYGEIVGHGGDPVPAPHGDNPAHRTDDGARESGPREYPENADARSADTFRT